VTWGLLEVVIVAFEFFFVIVVEVVIIVVVKIIIFEVVFVVEVFVVEIFIVIEVVFFVVIDFFVAEIFIEAVVVFVAAEHRGQDPGVRTEQEVGCCVVFEAEGIESEEHACGLVEKGLTMFELGNRVICASDNRTRKALSTP
jgi:hypothetical protein